MEVAIKSASIALKGGRHARSGRVKALPSAASWRNAVPCTDSHASPKTFSAVILLVLSDNGRGRPRKALDGEGAVLPVLRFGRHAQAIAVFAILCALLAPPWVKSVRQGCQIILSRKALTKFATACGC